MTIDEQLLKSTILTIYSKPTKKIWHKNYLVGIPKYNIYVLCGILTLERSVSYVSSPFLIFMNVD